MSNISNRVSDIANCVNNNNFEIERKFLVTSDEYRQLATGSVRIQQGYLSVNPTSTVRVRRWGDTAFLTIKGRPKEGEIGRFEWEKEISVAEAEQLFRLAVSPLIDKTRYLVPLADGLVCEVDEFHGLNDGLVLAEVELHSEQESFVLPTFLGEEVTADHRYYNSYLAQVPYSRW